MIIKLTDEIIEKCDKFAQDSIGTHGYYASRGQNNKDKIINDISTGKKGEWACYQMLLKKFPSIVTPDMEIYRGRKSHGADLSADEVKFSVKTQTLDSVKKYGMSWLWERSSLPKFMDHYVILCLLLDEKTVIIQNVVKFEKMLAVEAQPKLKYLTTKVAFYYDDILLMEVE